MKVRRRNPARAFTLLEILVVVVIIAVLAMVILGAASKVRGLARDRMEAALYRKLGQAIAGWAGDHGGAFPRSTHSAFANGQLGWQREILPYLGYPDTKPETFALAAGPDFGMVPDAKPPRRPAMNVYFELDPGSDDYDGAPQSWKHPASLPCPSSTVLLAGVEGKSSGPMADHIMAHYLAGRADDLPACAAGRPGGPVLWADGRASLEAPGTLFDPESGIDRFHPEKACAR